MTSHWLLRQAGLSSIWKKWSINAEFNLSLLVLTLRRALLRARTGSLLRWWSPPWRSSYFISAGFHIYYITTRINNKESFNYMNHFLCYLLISLTLSDTIWHCLILSDTIWYYLTIYDTVWHDLILSDIIWYCLTLSDTTWHYLIISDTIWYILTLSDIIWHYLILSDIIWYCLTLSDTIRHSLKLSDTTWVQQNYSCNFLGCYLVN